MAPHFTTLDLQERLEHFLAMLLATTLPCRHSSAPMSWLSQDVRVSGVRDDGKGRVLTDVLASHGLKTGSPSA